MNRSSAYGHAVPLTNYRHDPKHMSTVLNDAGFDVQTYLHRSPEGHEKTPQAIVLARRRH
ncbi:hypothetical protein [Cellulomonas fimi]|uniref:Uncharacterized protein n=1 Tax=Cellulomonas fimi TaxID=1708 RepID=A0A7Y0LWI7_CELFI|nr:hypothetical protein [Cellulomonas fimi]NMR19191.1 hypothetical protein [Cellulomonas fimi]